jgi:hypothetical protein
MNREEEKEKENEKAVLLSYVAYGIHFQFIKKRLLKKLESRYDARPFYIYEYFFIKPIIKNKNLSTSAATDNVKLPQRMFAPYLLRVLYEKDVIPDIKEIKNSGEIQNIVYNPISFKNIKSFWFQKDKKIPFVDRVPSNAIIIEALYKWKEDKNDEIVEITHSLGKRQISTWFSNILKITDPETEYALLQEFCLIDPPFYSLKGENDKPIVDFYSFSISSKSLFFGNLYIVCPYEISKGGFLEKNPDLKNEIKEVIKNVYVPLLLLYENMWEEKELEESLESKNSSYNWKGNVFLSLSNELNLTEMERALYELWRKRQEYYNKSNKEKIKNIKENLPFAKYNIASPALINEIRKIIIPRGETQQEKLKKDYLPCFLIIGGPGSGKDTIAKTVQLFFPEYRFGMRYIINMAALKPGVISVPLLSGGKLEFVDSSQSTPVSYTLVGIFDKIWKDFCERNRLEFLKEGLEVLKNKEIWEECKKNGLLPVVILDELNSLDIDAQGVLLRFLENGEIQPLGGVRSKKINFLVIGVVNEPEGFLTLEEPIREIRENKLFGRLLSHYFYEQFRGMRRLREDLYHRLIREGKINLKNIEERREDLPILFAHFVRKELGCKWNELWIDIDVFEILMSPHISWTGNFRQLQSIAKKVVNQIKNEEGVWRVKRKDIIEVLKEYGYKEEEL